MNPNKKKIESNKRNYEKLKADVAKCEREIRLKIKAPKKYKKKSHKKKKTYIRSWKKLRQIILKRDNFKCTECGSRRYLHVHHKSYKRVGSKKEVYDLITLCGNCHQITHGLKDNLLPRRGKI